LPRQPPPPPPQQRRIAPWKSSPAPPPTVRTTTRSSRLRSRRCFPPAPSPHGAPTGARTTAITPASRQTTAQSAGIALRRLRQAPHAPREGASPPFRPCLTWPRTGNRSLQPAPARAWSSPSAPGRAHAALHPWQFELVGHAARDSNGSAVHPGEKQVETVISGRCRTGRAEVEREPRGGVRHHTTVHGGSELLGSLRNLAQHEVLEAEPQHGGRLPRVRRSGIPCLTMLAQHGKSLDARAQRLPIGTAQ